MSKHRLNSIAFVAGLLLFGGAVVVGALSSLSQFGRLPKPYFNLTGDIEGYFERQDYRRGAEQLELFLKLNGMPKRDVLSNCGDELFKHEQYEEASRFYERAIRIGDNAATRRKLGSAKWNKGLPDEALEQLQKALELDPHDAATCYLMGIVLEGSGRPAEASESYARALELDPDHAKARARLRSLQGK